jgi:hypothetical protein
MDQIGDRSRVNYDLFEIENDLAERREQAHQCNNTKR